MHIFSKLDFTANNFSTESYSVKSNKAIFESMLTYSLINIIVIMARLSCLQLRNIQEQKKKNILQNSKGIPEGVLENPGTENPIRNH